MAASVALCATAVLGAGAPADAHAPVAHRYRVFGGPSLTVYDQSDGAGGIRPGYLVVRQAPSSATGGVSAAPFQDVGTIVGTSSKGDATYQTTGSPVGEDTTDPPQLYTSYSLGQDQNDPGTVAVTANVTTSDGGTTFARHRAGPVWVQTFCGAAGYCLTDLGRAGRSAPAVVNADGTIWVFARFGRHIAGNVRPRGSTTWSGWRSLGHRRMLGGPAAAVVGSQAGMDTIEVLATARNHRPVRQLVTAIGDASQPGQPSGQWASLPSRQRSRVGPAIAFSQSSWRVVLAVVGRAGNVRLSTDAGDTWTTLPGVQVGRSAPALLGDTMTSQVEVAVRGADDRTYVATSQDGGATFGSWVQIPCDNSGGTTIC